MSSLLKKIIICFLFVLSCCYANPSVTIDQGTLRGINMVTHNGRIVSGFLGIPYAQPPVGKLRFKAPQPPKSWTGTYRAENGSIQCTQVFKGKLTGAEDCLYLNVYTPQLPQRSSRLLPVMVMIHGGSFKEGSAGPATHGPQYILDHNVVLVTMNYRLGIFGFLSTGDDVSPGNYALKDQLMALRWVQSNIDVFGGDADRVTLLGMSAGATCAHFLSFSNKTEGLFHKLILQSGTAVGHYGYRDMSLAAKWTQEIAKSFDCPIDNSTVIVRCLRNLKAFSLASWSKRTLEILFIPTSEPESDEAIITDSPYNSMEQGKMRDMPWICGNVLDEGLLRTAYDYANSTRMEDTVSHLRDTIKGIVELLRTDDVTGYVEAIMAYYFNDWTIDRTMIIKNYTLMFGDLYYLYPTINLLYTQARVGHQAGYNYLFKYRGTFSMSYEMTGDDTDMGVCHGDESIYLFPRANTSFAPLKRNMSHADLNMMKKLTGLWTSFAINGVPTLLRMDQSERWRKYDDQGSYLEIGNKANVSLIMKTSLYEHRMNFWRKLLNPRNFGSKDASASIFTIFVAVYVILSNAHGY